MLQSRSRGCLEHVETSCAVAVADVAYVLRRTHHAHINAHTQDITCLEDGDGVGKEGVAFHVLAHTSKGGYIVVSSPDDMGTSSSQPAYRDECQDISQQGSREMG